MPDFLKTLRALSDEAIPAPWEVYESDDGEWGLIHRRASGMVRPVADFPGSGEGGSSASDASVDLVELLRNSSARIAALIEAATRIRDSATWGDSVEPSADGYPRRKVEAHEDLLTALDVALNALDKE